MKYTKLLKYPMPGIEQMTCECTPDEDPGKWVAVPCTKYCFERVHTRKYKCPKCGFTFTIGEGNTGLLEYLNDKVFPDHWEDLIDNSDRIS